MSTMIHEHDDGGWMPRWLLPRGGVAVGSLLAFLALLPFGGLYNIPLLLLGGLGLLCLTSRRRAAFGDDGLRLLLVLFLCIWAPMAISVVDAADPIQAWRKVLGFPVFFLAGAYVVLALRRSVDLQRLLVGVWIICLFWSVDASWQFMSGFNVLGFPPDEGLGFPPGELVRITGIFHPDLKLGIVLVTVSPFVFEATRRLAGRSAWVLLALIPFFAAIVLSGGRSSWIMLLVAAGGYGWYLLRWAGETFSSRAVLRVAAVGVLACGVLASTLPNAAGQMQEVLIKRAMAVVDLARRDRQVLDESLVARLALWESAGHMFRDHWLNGVGPRGFRKIHPDYAPAHDPYVRGGRTQNHPHMLVLEIAAETGVVGLLGYLVALAVLMRRFLDMDRRMLAFGFPYLLACAVVLFPFVTHLAFYAHFMGALIWWTIAIAISGLCALERRESGEEGSRPPNFTPPATTGT